MMFLRFRPLGAIERLMGYQVVHRSELDATRDADQLDQWR